MLTKTGVFNSGQSLIEIILASAIFMIIASSCLVIVVGSLSTGRLAEEQSKATLLATEGLEAVQSIRNSSWNNLTDGNHGLVNNGTWSFVGVSDTDQTGKYIRTISITSVYRDSLGDITQTGGTLDPETKKIISTVSWNFTSSRQNSVILPTYLTDWKKGKSVGTIVGISTCSQLCQSLAYTTGTCRQSIPPCASHGEVYQSTGDQFCLTNPNKACCCLP